MQPAASNTTPETNLFSEGFLALRAGIFDHLNQSLFTPNEWMTYTVLLRQCDWRYGRWNGNAHRIRAAVGNVMTIRQIRQAMSRLVVKGYTRGFHKKGAKGNYFVLIHKYRVCVGELKGKVLNAIKSDSYIHPVYEDGCEREVIDTLHGSDLEVTLKCDGSQVVLYQDIQDVQASKNARKVGVVVGQPSPSSQIQNHSGKENLLVEMREIYEHHGRQNTATWNTSPAHEETAHQLSVQYGRRDFLMAFDNWCYWDACDQLETRNSEGLMFPIRKFLTQDISHYIKKSQEPSYVKRRCPLIKDMEFENATAD